jgi:hypothetical protein
VLRMLERATVPMLLLPIGRASLIGARPGRAAQSEA